MIIKKYKCICKYNDMKIYQKIIKNSHSIKCLSKNKLNPLGLGEADCTKKNSPYPFVKLS